MATLKRRKTDNSNSKNQEYLNVFLDSLIAESRQEREFLRNEIKELAHETNRKIESLSIDTNKKINRISDIFTEKFDEITIRQKSDPKLWLQAGALLLTFFVMAGGLIITNQRGVVGPINQKLHNTTQTLESHVHQAWHPQAGLNHARHEERFSRAFEKMNVNDESIRDLDEVLQREIVSLQKLIEKEMELVNGRTHDRLKRLEKKTGVSP